MQRLVVAGLAALALAGDASAASPAPSATAPVSPLVREFIEANHVERVLGDWMQQLEKQWIEHLPTTRATIPPGFYEAAIATFDLDAQRAELAKAVAAEVSEAEMRADLEWLRATGVRELDAQAERLATLVTPLRDELLAAARRVDQRLRAGGAPPPPSPSRLPPLSARWSEADVAKIHRLMDVLGYGSPRHLESLVVAQARRSLPQAVPATWSDPEWRDAVIHAVRGTEQAFAQAWTPDQAGALAEALTSEAGRRHDELMTRVSKAAMTRLLPFAEAVRSHVVEAYKARGLPVPQPAAGPPRR